MNQLQEVFGPMSQPCGSVYPNNLFCEVWYEEIWFVVIWDLGSHSAVLRLLLAQCLNITANIIQGP